MAKPLRTAQTGNPGIGLVVRYGAIFGGTLCLVGLVFTLLHKLLPLLHVLVPALILWWLWQRYRKVQTRQQKHLHTTFYHLLRDHQGRMTLLDFAMTAEIPAIAAQSYLNSRAKEFSARFEVTEQGDVVYVFSTLAASSPQASCLEPTLTSTAVLADTLTNRITDTLPDNSDHTPVLPDSLTQADLAKRLDVAAKTVSRKKYLPTFSDWTQIRDPNGVGWSYDAQAQRFFPMGDRPLAQPETD